MEFSLDDSFGTLLARLGGVLASAKKLEDFFAASVSMIQESLAVEGCSIFLIDSADNCLKIKAATSIPQSDWPSIQFAMGVGIVGKVAQSGRALWAKDISEVKAGKGETVRKRYKNPSFASVPIQLQGETIGVINTDSKLDGSLFTDRDVNGLHALAGLFASALSTSMLLEERAKSNDYFDSILQSVPMGVMAFNNDLRMTHCNRAAADLVGSIDVKLAKEAPLNSLFPGELRNRVLELIEELKRSGASASFEIEYSPGLKITPMPLGVRACAMRDRNNAPVGVILVLENLRMRKEIRELRQLDELKSHFLSLISHELRTPLTSIKGAVHLLTETEGMQYSDIQQRLLDIVDRNVTRLTEVVDHILDVQTVQTEKVDLDFKPVVLEELIQECIDASQKKWKEKGIEPTVQVIEPIPGVLHVDRSRMLQVFQHLLDNAFKFSEKESSVSVRIEGMNGTVNIRVTNCGVPIPSQFRDQIFEYFYQVESTMTRHIGGVGTGLYLARELLRLHGGELALERSDEECTTFLVTLPIKAP